MCPYCSHIASDLFNHRGLCIPTNFYRLAASATTTAWELLACGLADSDIRSIQRFPGQHFFRVVYVEKALDHFRDDDVGFIPLNPRGI